MVWNLRLRNIKFLLSKVRINSDSASSACLAIPIIKHPHPEDEFLAPRDVYGESWRTGGLREWNRKLGDKNSGGQEGLVLSVDSHPLVRTLRKSTGLKWMQKYEIPMVQWQNDYGVSPQDTPSPRRYWLRNMRAGVPAHLRKVAEEGPGMATEE